MPTYEDDPETLYQETSLEDMKKWIEDCETNAEVPLHRGGTAFTDWQREFLESVREQFDTRTAAGSKKPLSGKQLVKLKEMWDRI